MTLEVVLDRLETKIGEALLLVDGDERLLAFDFREYEARMHRLLRLGHGEVRIRRGRAPAAVRRAVEGYFGGDLDALDTIRIRMGGTPFQRKVWTALRRIPRGTTLSYGALAARIGAPKAVRAVGLANGANPICIVVPCHRVIGADGSLTGYGGGLPRKRWLLNHEGVRLGAGELAAAP
jgi:methylated-DNA-[protein]-cysteine S-methyltransferase